MQSSNNVFTKIAFSIYYEVFNQKKLLVFIISLSNLLFNHNRLAQSITCLDFKD